MGHHHEVVAEPTGKFGGGARLRVTDQRQIDVLFERGHLNEESAKERGRERWESANALLRLAYSAGTLGAVESQIGRLIRVDAPHDEKVSRLDAAMRLRRLLSGLRDRAGDDGLRLVVMVVIYDRTMTGVKQALGMRWKKALALLRASLDALGEEIQARRRAEAG